jgi:HD-like signal output (HDOD) protein
MRSKSDFPVLASTISEINRIVDDDSASANLLTQCILQDFALTNKLLKLVNTVTYGQFGGQINTISKAVVILGFESVRNVAMTLILLDFLQNKAQVSQLKDDVLASFFSGIVAVQFSAGLNIRDAEEAMICSMFRNLGKLLASFYFFEESQQVARLVEQGESEDSAAIQVLGISYNELGIGVAKSWSFPPRLIIGMRKVAGDKIAKPQGELDNLSVTVNLAHELCAIASHGHALDKAKALKQLVRRYEDAINTSEQQLRKTMENGMGELAARAKVVGIDLAHSLLMKRVKVWIGAKSEVVADKKPLEPDSLAGITQLGMEIESQSERVGEIPKITPEAMLTEGIQEITNTLVEDHKLNDIIQMVLETMYRAMGFNRTLFLVRDVKAHKMVARFGFGQDADAVLPKFRFSLDFTADVFHLAMSKGADLMIEDIAAENIVGKIPSWYRQAVSSQSFMLLPVVVNSKPVGIFYADMGQANTMLVSPKQLSLLRTLRNQAVLAIKQKS